MWYDSGCWWFRPRYGRWVRYKVPHSYYELRYRAKQHGIPLPAKPPRELNIPYKENEIRKLMKQEDPELFKRVEKEHKSGNLEKMRKEYVTQTEKKIAVKNQEYKKYNQEKKTQVKSDASKQNNSYPTNKRVDKTPVKTSNTKYTDDKYYNDQKSEPKIIKREKSESKSNKTTPQQYYNDEEKKTNQKQTSNTERQSPDYNEKREPSPQKSNYKQTSPVQKSSSSNEKKSTDNYKLGVVKKKR